MQTREVLDSKDYTLEKKACHNAGLATDSASHWMQSLDKNCGSIDLDLDVPRENQFMVTVQAGIHIRKLNWLVDTWLELFSAYITCHCICVSCDWPYNDHSGCSLAGLLSFLEVFQEEIGQEEMAQVICSHTKFKSICCEFWLLCSGKINCRITDHTIQGQSCIPREDSRNFWENISKNLVDIYVSNKVFMAYKSKMKRTFWTSSQIDSIDKSLLHYYKFHVVRFRWRSRLSFETYICIIQSEATNFGWMLSIGTKTYQRERPIAKGDLKYDLRSDTQKLALNLEKIWPQSPFNVFKSFF